MATFLASFSHYIHFFGVGSGGGEFASDQLRGGVMLMGGTGKNTETGVVREQRGKQGEWRLTESFFQFEFRFRNGLGRTLALRKFCNTQLIIAEIFASFCKM